MEPIFIVGEREVKVRGSLLRIGRIEGDSYRFLDDPQSFVSQLRKSSERLDLFTFVQRLPDTAPRYPYPTEWDNVAALRVSTFEHWWNDVLGFKARNKAKQAEKKGVVIREVPFDKDLVEGIWKIYNESPVRQGKRFPHYGMTREAIRRYAGTFLEASVFIGAFFEGDMIGFAKVTADETNTQAGLMHILSLIQHRDKSPTNALVAGAVRSCASRNIPYLVYSSFSYGNKRRDSLSDFKERNGFQRIDIPRYYVPLTRLGQIGFRMRMHRSMIELLPEGVITRLRDYRSSWYNDRIPSSLQGN
jgi:hypothetical protein